MAQSSKKPNKVEFSKDYSTMISKEPTAKVQIITPEPVQVQEEPNGETPIQEVKPPVSVMGSTGGAGKTASIEQDDSKDRITYYMKNKYITLVSRAAYWDRVAQADVVEAALEMYFKDKEYEPTPKEKK